jgi:hypothetical protein
MRWANRDPGCFRIVGQLRVAIYEEEVSAKFAGADRRREDIFENTHQTTATFGSSRDRYVE